MIMIRHQVHKLQNIGLPNLDVIFEIKIRKNILYALRGKLVASAQIEYVERNLIANLEQDMLTTLQRKHFADFVKQCWAMFKGLYEAG